jgi:hypothetical protein
MWDELNQSMTAIRDLVSEHPLNAVLWKDRDSWDRLCRGLDEIQDAATLSGRLSALNAVRAELGMSLVEADGGEIVPALTAGVEAVRAELEQRCNAIRDSHSERLSDLFHESQNYLLGKASSAARSRIPGEHGETFDIDRPATNVLLKAFERFVAQLRARGYDDSVCSEPEEAVYILRRSQAVNDGARDFNPRDVYLLVRYALPVLSERTVDLAAEIDEDTARREPGWMPPGGDEG